MKTKAALFLTVFAIQLAAAEKIPKVEVGAFLDTFYAFDFSNPPNRERSFTTNPTRHNEFNVNLAFVEAKINSEQMRGRLALQAGTSVFSNYSTELRDSTKGGGSQLADVLMHLQEAYAGYRITPNLWVDAGIYFSHIGAEGFISRDNWTYTRSLIADFSPYYQTGARLSWEPNSTWAFQLHVLNGWQNILETNGDKALGTQIVYRPTGKWTFTHNSFVGREADVRVFQDFIAKYQMSPEWETSVSIDLGLQKKGAGLAKWWGISVLNRFRLTQEISLGARVEYYEDPESVIVLTGTPNGFQVWGASMNLDTQLTSQLFWRNELRFLHSKDSVFSHASAPSRSTVFATTSVALSL